MIDLSKLTFTEEASEQNGGKDVIGSVTLRAGVHVAEGSPATQNDIEAQIRQRIMRGIYGDLVPHVIALVQFSQSRCAMPSDTAKVLGLSNQINAILLGDPSLAAAPVERPLIKPVRRF